MAEQQKAKAKGRKIGRNKKHQAAVYKAEVRLEKNRKRRMRRHLRANPSDAAVRKRYELTFGRADSMGLNSRGRKLQRRAEKLQVIA